MRPEIRVPQLLLIIALVAGALPAAAATKAVPVQEVEVPKAFREWFQVKIGAADLTPRMDQEESVALSHLDTEHMGCWNRSMKVLGQMLAQGEINLAYLRSKGVKKVHFHYGHGRYKSDVQAVRMDQDGSELSVGVTHMHTCLSQAEMESRFKSQFSQMWHPKLSPVDQAASLALTAVMGATLETRKVEKQSKQTERSAKSSSDSASLTQEAQAAKPGVASSGR